MVAVLVELFPVLVGLYLLDCLTRIDPWEDRLSRGFDGRYRSVLGGVRLVGLMPTARVHAVDRRQIEPTTGGLFLFEPTPGLPPVAQYRRDWYRFVRYELISSVERDGRRLVFVCKDRSPHSVVLASESAANARLTNLRELIAASETERRSLLKRRFDPVREMDRVRRVLETGERRLWFAETASLLLWAQLFLVLPGLVVWSMFAQLVVRPLPLALSVGTAWIASALGGLGAYRGLRRDGLAVPRHAVTNLFLMPPAAARTAVSLGRDLLAGCDFRAVAAVLLAPYDLLVALRRERAGIALALEESEEPPWRALWERRREELDRLLTVLEISDDRMDRVSVDDAPDSAGFCVFCLGGFRVGIVHCDACQTVLLPVGDEVSD